MGVNVQLTKLRIEGLKPDGDAYPGADITCMVLFDPYAAGCDLETCFCNLGAQVAWYVNGTLVQDTPWSGCNHSLGDQYVATYSFTAPQSGYMYVQAESANTIDFSFDITPTDQDAGTVSISDVYCGNSPYNNASCDGAILIIYFLRNIVTPGNGTAYVDVYMDGSLIAGNVAVSTTGYSGEPAYYSYTVSCPNSSTAHTILVRGKNGDVGASIVLPAGSGGDPCITNPCSYGCPDAIGANRCALCGIDCGTDCQTNPCLDSCSNKPCTQCPTQIGCIHSDGSGIWDQILAFITEQPAVALVGAGVLAYALARK